MIRNHIVRDYSDYARDCGFDKTEHDLFRGYLSLKAKMYNDAIRNNGIFKTFRDSGKYHDLILDYIKIEDTDIELYLDMFEKRSKFRGIYLCNQTDQSIQEYRDILNSCIMYNETNEIDDTLKHEFEVIKERCVKDFDAVYSTVKIDNIDINKDPEIIFIHYSYYYIKDEFIDKIDSDDVIFGEAPLPYEEWFNSDSHSIDGSGKVNIALSEDVYKALNKGYIDCTPPDFTTERYYSENAIKELIKENKNMRMLVHLLIVPEGMNEEFVNNTKKNLQSDDEAALYVSSNDIAFEPNDEYKTKYDLLEYWVKSGQIHCVEFMVGYENDPEVKAFETFIKGFIRGIKTNSSSVDTVNLWYQKDTIKRTIDSLMIDYAESSKARERLDNITDKIMDKVKVFKEYGLEDDDFDKIHNANCYEDAWDATIDKITEIAFDSDKKGNKKK